MGVIGKFGLSFFLGHAPVSAAVIIVFSDILRSHPFDIHNSVMTFARGAACEENVYSPSYDINMQKACQVFKNKNTKKHNP